jgi:hypothetical protein
VTAHALALAIALITLQGCTRAVEPVQPPAQPYEVKVPVLVKATPPDSLALPYVPTEFPTFVNPDAPGVVYGLTKEGWERLQTILRTLHTRDQAWRSWATGHGEPNE